MVLQRDYLHESSHTQQTTRRSPYFQYGYIPSDIAPRVLIATMKSNGSTLVPNALFQKKLIRQVGTPMDMKVRVQKTTRRANKDTNDEVKRAQEYITTHGVHVQHKDVVWCLNSKSLAPVEVSKLQTGLFQL